MIRSVQSAGSLVALAVCAACSGYSASAPSSGGLNYQYIGKTLVVNGRPVAAARLSPMPRYTTIVPDRFAKSKKLVYIIPGIFDYPKGDKEIGQLSTYGQGCTNVLYGYGKKTFWIVVGASQITEYQVPKKPIKTLSVAYSFPSSCAMNTSGDLAIGIFLSNSYGPGGQVVIYKNATGSPTVYNTPLASEYFDGYDNKGNLFADGLNSAGVFALIELRQRSSKFQTIATSNTAHFPGSVQWDGTYLTVLDQLTNEIYQYAVSGTKATLKNAILLSGAGDCVQTWIVKGFVLCADAGDNDGEVFKYPAGGSAIATLTGSFSPIGAVAAQR